MAFWFGMEPRALAALSGLAPWSMAVHGDFCEKDSWEGVTLTNFPELKRKLLTRPGKEDVSSSS